MSGIEEVLLLSSVTIGITLYKTYKKIKYKNKKKKLKTRLKKSFEKRNKKDIIKNIESLKDFDSKKHTNKLEKYLYDLIDEIPFLNKDFVLSLINNFNEIDNIFNDENIENKINHVIENNNIILRKKEKDEIIENYKKDQEKMDKSIEKMNQLIKNNLNDKKNEDNIIEIEKKNEEKLNQIIEKLNQIIENKQNKKK